MNFSISLQQIILIGALIYIYLKVKVVKTIHYIALIIILYLLFQPFLNVSFTSAHGGKIVENFAFINDDISIGNPSSISGLVAADGPASVYQPNIKNPYADEAVTFQGDGIPLAYETRVSFPANEDDMFYFKDWAFEPECCPSIYSSDRGCACWHPYYTPEPQTYPRLHGLKPVGPYK